MDDRKKILIPGGKLSDWALVNAAHKLGMYVITSGTDKAAPAHKFSDKYICADYSDKEAMLKIAKDEKIDYMCTCANDFGMLSTAYVCEKLGLPGHDSYETTWSLHHKDTFKAVAKKLGLHSPVSEVFSDRDEAIEYIRNSKEKLIIKPSDNVASKGVSTPTKEDVAEKVDEAFAYSKDKKIIVEPFIEGYFAPATSFIINKKVVCFFTLGSFHYPEGDRNTVNRFPMSDHCNGSMIPSPDHDEFVDDIIDDFNKLAEYYNLVDGKLHCELVVTPDHKAYIFDIHRRMSGFNYPWSDWDISGEICWPDWIVKAECGMDLSDFPVGIKQQKYIHLRDIYAPKDGIIKSVIFDEYLTSHMYPKVDCKEYKLFDCFVTDHRHNPIVDNSESKGKPIMRFAFDSKEEAEKISDPNGKEFYSHITFNYVEQY